MHLSTVLTLLPLALSVSAGPIQKRAPILRNREANARVLPGKYIVKFAENANEAAIDAAIARINAHATYKYTDNKEMKGFAAAIADSELESIQTIPEVEYLEEDAIINAYAYVSQTNAPWGLGRISHDEPSTTYTYDDSAGSGVCAYVIDTGILTTHSQFSGRASFLYNAIDNSNTDGNGHGTHVAGTIAGTTYGVAKKATLLAVKVLDSSGSGSTSGVVAGMNRVASDAATRSCAKGKVANMSLGGATSTSINNAAAAITRAGVFLAVAAGNENANAANSSPASAPSACTVGATTSADARSSFSNYGAVVDIFAPGSNILSSYIGSNSATATLSGTSMASPHIAGLGAYLLALEGAMSPAALCTRIQTLAFKNELTGIPSGTQNLLAFNGNPNP